MRHKFLAAVILVAVTLAVGTKANAATCPASTSVPYIEGTTNTSDTATCEQYADSGNLNGHTGGPASADDPFLATHTTFVYLDSTDPSSTSGAADGALTIPTGDGTPSGTWAINSSLVAGYTNFALGIKDGNHNPDWAVFLLGANWALGGTWAIANPDMNLSHAILYAEACDGPCGISQNPFDTPLPAGLPLFATGLGALGLLGWRKKRKAKTSA